MTRTILRLTLLLTMVAGSAAAAERPFAEWLGDFRAEAMRKGVSAPILDAAFAGVEPIARVIELDRRQPESTLTFEEYRDRVVSAQRITDGRQRMIEHARILEQIQARYGVPARFIVALWGVETSYGRITGNFSVVGALATLAYDGRRSAYFRAELLNALRILQEGHISPTSMRGSWAGAMGQSQFMPSSFLRFAVDHDGDGRRDIWGTQSDVFASIANYLAGSGWNSGQTWGRAVRLPASFDTSLAGADGKRALARWSKLGVVQLDGSPLPASELLAEIVLPAKRASPAFATYDNFRVLLRWNRSNYFALAVSDLADRLAAP